MSAESFEKRRQIACSGCRAEITVTARTAKYCGKCAKLRAQKKNLQASGLYPTGAAGGDDFRSGARMKLNFRATIGLTQQEYEDFERLARANGYRHVGAYLRAFLIAMKEGA